MPSTRSRRTMFSSIVTRGTPPRIAESGSRSTGRDSARASAWTYVVVNKEPDAAPRLAYWRTLVDGARERGLPGTYLEMLEAIAHLH